MNKTPHRFDRWTKYTYPYRKVRGGVTQDVGSRRTSHTYLVPGCPVTALQSPAITRAGSISHTPHHQIISSRAQSRSHGSISCPLPHDVLSTKKSGPRASPGVSSSYDNGEASRPAGPWASSGSSLPFHQLGMEILKSTCPTRVIV